MEDLLVTIEVIEIEIENNTEDEILAQGGTGICGPNTTCIAKPIASIN